MTKKEKLTQRVDEVISLIKELSPTAVIRIQRGRPGHEDSLIKVYVPRKLEPKVDKKTSKRCVDIMLEDNLLILVLTNVLGKSPLELVKVPMHKNNMTKKEKLAQRVEEIISLIKELSPTAVINVHGGRRGSVDVIIDAYVPQKLEMEVGKKVGKKCSDIWSQDKLSFMVVSSPIEKYQKYLVA